MKKVEHSASKRFKEAGAMVDAKKTYPIAEAIELAKKTASVKFDSSIEVHVKLNIDVKKGDQQIRSSIGLPHGTGKTVKVAVFTADAEQQKNAKTAGADLVGDKELIEEIKNGKINFDILVAAPSAMKDLAPVAKILGPKGMMPNPKDGTVTEKIAEAVANLKKGQVNYKNDDTGNVHVTIGKASFDTQKLIENFNAFFESLKKVKPATIKGAYIENISLSSTMGPGIKVEINK